MSADGGREVHDSARFGDRTQAVESRFIVAVSLAQRCHGELGTTKGHTVKIRSVMGLVGAGTVVVAGALALSGGAAMAAPHSSAPTAYTCSGGDLATNTFVDIPSGNYASITVAGVCDVPDNAVISVVGNVNVLAGAVLCAERTFDHHGRTQRHRGCGFASRSGLSAGRRPRGTCVHDRSNRELRRHR